MFRYCTGKLVQAHIIKSELCIHNIAKTICTVKKMCTVKEYVIWNRILYMLTLNLYIYHKIRPNICQWTKIWELKLDWVEISHSKFLDAKFQEASFIKNEFFCRVFPQIWNTIFFSRFSTFHIFHVKLNTSDFYLFWCIDFFANLIQTLTNSG